MPCYHPLHGFYARNVNASGKRSLVFKLEGSSGEGVTVSCGACIGCRIDRTRAWAVRAMHEAQLHEESCFLTLTYNDEHVPGGGTLVKKDHQDFMKRLRKRIGKRVSYLHCGEYGEQLGRPHYHDLLFGHEFKDRVLHSRTRDGAPLWTSMELESLWQKGFCLIGAVTFQSAAYVARYALKKVTGEAAKKHYLRVVPETGELVELQPEYISVSLKPALAKKWFEQFQRDVYPDDFVTVAGKRVKVPKFYDKQLEEFDADVHAQLKERRQIEAKKRWRDSTGRRLADREEVKLAQLSQLKRTL